MYKIFQLFIKNCLLHKINEIQIKLIVISIIEYFLGRYVLVILQSNKKLLYKCKLCKYLKGELCTLKTETTQNH